MTFLLQFYPGDQITRMVAMVIGQVAFLVFVAFFLSRFPTRRRAATRSAIWLATLVCVLSVPLLAASLEFAEVTIIRLPMPVVTMEKTEVAHPTPMPPAFSEPDVTTAVHQQDVEGSSYVPVADLLPQAVGSRSPMVASRLISRSDKWRAVGSFLMLFWLAGVSVCAVRFLYGCLALTRLRKDIREVDDTAITVVLEDICRTIGMQHIPKLVTSQRLTGPVATSGLKGRTVILPKRLLSDLNDRQLRDILTHECAHFAQHDIFVGVLQRIAQIVYWPHPMVHFLNRELHAAREDICDNHVLQQGDAPGYARTLVQLSTSVPVMKTPITACGMLSPVSRLETRVAELLNERRDLMTRTKRSSLVLFGFVFLTMSILTFGTRQLEVTGANTTNNLAAVEQEDDSKAAQTIASELLFSSGSGPRILAVAISPDDELIATVDEQANVVVRTANNGGVLLSFSALKRAEKKLLLHEDRKGRIHTAGIAFSPDPRLLTRTLAVACDTVIRFYDSETGRLERSLEDKRFINELKELGKDDPTEVKRLNTIPHAHGRVYSIAFSPDGSLLASSGSHLLRPGGRSVINSDIPTHGKLKLWDAKTGELKNDLGKHYSRIRSLSFSPDSLGVIGSHPPGPWTSSVRLWNPRTGTVQRTIRIHSSLYRESVALSPDGALVAVATAYQDPQPAGETIERLGFGSPKLLVWNAKTGDLVIERKMSKLVTSIAFSPDSKTLATCTQEGVTLWEPKTLREKGKLQSSTKPPRPELLAFSANGTRMAVVANDNDKKQGLLTLWKLDKANTVKPQETDPVGDAINKLIEQLSSPDQKTRDAAAEKLRESYLPPGRKLWDKLLAKTKTGDIKKVIWKRFGVDKEKIELGIGTGQVHKEEYRLDDRWMFSGWFNNADDSLREAKIVERVRDVWLKPAGDFSGIWVTYFVNGRRSHEIQYKDGNYHGRFTRYHGNGSKSYTQNYVSHVADGEDTGYFPTGEVMYRGVYKAGKQVGVWTWYEKDGSIRTERDNGGKPRAEENAKKHGKLTRKAATIARYGGIMPSFNCETATWNATHIIVVDGGGVIDGDFQVIEAWKGDLAAGSKLSIPELAIFKDANTRKVSDWFRKHEANPRDVVTGRKMVLFLVKSGQSEGDEWLSAMMHFDHRHYIDYSVVWVENQDAYAIEQPMNPGPNVIVPLEGGIAKLNAEVERFLKLRSRFNKAAEKKDAAERAKALHEFAISDSWHSRYDAFAALGLSGPAAAPVLRSIIDDIRLLRHHGDAIKALSAALANDSGNDLLKVLREETRFWKKNGPKLQVGWWNSNDDVKPLRLRYTRLIATLRSLEKHPNAAAKEAVEDLRDFWRSLPQLEDKTGLNEISENCSRILKKLAA